MTYSRTRTALLLVLLGIGAAGSIAQAQEQTPPPPPARPPNAARAVPGADDVQAWFDAMVVVQAQRVLALTDAQYPQFITRLKALQEARRRNQHARRQAIREIARMTSPATATVDEAQLREKLRALDDLQTKAMAEVRKAYENLDQVLDLRQQARFRVFEEQIERRKLEFLLNARRRGAAAPNPRPPAENLR